MLKKIVEIFGGDPHRELLEKLDAEVEYINELEAEFEQFSKEDLRSKTAEFRLRLARGETLDDILPQAFAAVREASKRTIGQRHFDVQMIGGIAMHREYVAEMKTGEGKTLGATLPLYLNALALNPQWVKAAREKWGEDPDNWKFERVKNLPVGRGVHLVTVNDYLARRDARWMAPIYELLGMNVGVLQMAARTEHGKKAFLIDLALKSPHEDRHQLDMVPRQRAYQADILYGTNNEFGFDFLRDNMAMKLEDRVQRGHYYAIIDEVDNVLIDEARTPLIISGPSHDDPEWYRRMASIVKKLNPEDYEIDIRDRNITLTPLGETHVEELLGRSLGNPARPEDITPEQARLLGYLEQALRAEYIFKRNKDYLVQAGKVVIIDDFTGRLMPGRRWSDGLHQAVEAKENVKVQSENVTYATITIQNYFRMYEKLSGMTGTAVTEAEEFNEIYNLDPIAIPTNLDYVATWTDSPLITLQGREEGTGFEYTYYANRNDPDREPIYWKRKDYSDVIYLSEEAKLRAIVEEIVRFHIIGRPILVGTTSVENSDRLSNRLEGPAIRMLAYILLVRDSWMRKQGRQPDGRRVPQLGALNTSLEVLKTTDLRNLAKELELDLALNIKSPENIDRLLEILGLASGHRERLEQVLRRGIDHDVLNARKHTEESQIIAGAGGFGAVTIATSMAGRGVDIKLGGEVAEEILADVVRVLDRAGHENPYDRTMAEQKQALLELSSEDYGIYESEIDYFLNHMEDKKRVKERGGLHVIGSERHEARRIDNQLRGRAARQGDPGSSRFYLSLEDELMARFGGQQMEGLLNRMQIDESMPIENRLVDRVVEQSQSRVEGANFDVRKHLLEYDDVLNTQREKVYQQRERIFTKDDLSKDVTEMLITEVENRIEDLFWDEEQSLEFDQTWKFLSWVSQTQPNLNFQEDKFPSYTIRLILDDIQDQISRPAPEEIQPVLLEIARETLSTEQDYILQTVDQLVDDRMLQFENQLANRVEILDTFMDGLSLGDEEGTRQSVNQLQDELSQLLRMRIELENPQWQQLRDEVSFQIRDLIEEQVAEYLMGLELKRLVGAVERIMGEPLELEEFDFEQSDWDDLREEIKDRVRELFETRTDRYLGDPQEGLIIKSIQSTLNGFPEGELGENQMMELLESMAEGRRATFDKKSHRRVWLRTNRLNYSFYAADILSSRSRETIEKDAVDHLVSAQRRILNAWGRSESTRLADNALADLEDLQDLLQEELGEEYEKFADQKIGELPEELSNQVEDILGRAALSKIYRQLLLRVISELWVEYLTEMEALRVSIGLEAYAQRDPLVQYKTKGFEMFQNLMKDMRMSVVNRMFTFQPRDVSSVQTAISEGELGG
ncbi:MAG: hypothetical protein U5K99_04410 [Anaerolineales bacterium]|nr:hypothetical protein [Anaerolineales bacterium]